MLKQHDAKHVRVKEFAIRHVTVYRYRRPVTLGPHRLMLRPRDSHDLRLLEAQFVFSPPGTVKWVHDVFGNSVANVSFAEASAELRIESILKLELYGADLPVFELEPSAARYPFAYSMDDAIDLGRMREPHYPDPENRLALWARGFVLDTAATADTLALLADLNAGIRAQFGYQVRDEQGTQTPLETLRRGWGTCRDFAVLLIEAARSLGFGARIVTGYLYSPNSVDAGSTTMDGASGTHAWAEIYLPGAGWIAYDPTHGTVGSTDLIRIAVARDISQVIPISGSFAGDAEDYLGMTVTATVTSTGIS